MKLTRGQKKAKMQASAERLIEELLEWDERTAEPNLTAIEDAVLKLRQRFGEEMADVLVEGQESRQPVMPPECEKCGRAMRNKGQKHRGVESRLGELEVERGYYYCAHCDRGLFPPGPPT